MIGHYHHHSYLHYYVIHSDSKVLGAIAQSLGGGTIEVLKTSLLSSQRDTYSEQNLFFTLKVQSNQPKQA